MSTKKSPELKETENEELETAKGEEPTAEDGAGMQQELKAQAAEIERLKKQLAEARKPAARTQDDAAVVRQAAKEAAESHTDPWGVIVSVRAPHRQRNEDPWYWLNVNGRSVQVPADDRYHEMKLPWAEALINSLEAERYAADFQDSIEVFDPVTNPHRD